MICLSLEQTLNPYLQKTTTLLKLQYDAFMTEKVPMMTMMLMMVILMIMMTKCPNKYANIMNFD